MKRNLRLLIFDEFSKLKIANWFYEYFVVPLNF